MSQTCSSLCKHFLRLFAAHVFIGLNWECCSARLYWFKLGVLQRVLEIDDVFLICMRFHLQRVELSRLPYAVVK